ncbi:hypothetical protein SALBM311S_09184 [Streptomyces alboniger]
MPGDDVRDDVPDDQQRTLGTDRSGRRLIRRADRTGPGPLRGHVPAQAAAIRPASRTLPRTAARLALSEAPSVCRTR